MRNFTHILIGGMLLALANSAAANANDLGRVAKAEQARLSGVWLITRGDGLSRICKGFFPQEPIRARQCVRDFVAENPQAFRHGQPDLLRSGKKLTLPASLWRPATPAPAAAESTAAITAPLPTAAAAATTTTAQVAVGTQQAAPSAAPAPARVAVPTPVAPATSYLDKLIDGTDAQRDGTDSGQTIASDALPGQRFIGIEFFADAKDESARGKGNEQAINVRYRRETENWGEWVLDAAVRRLDAAPGDRIQSSDGNPRATLFHNLFPLTERWVANSIVGIIRNPLNPLVTNSFRLSLPSPLYAGVATNIGDGQRELRFAAGQIGTLYGLAAGAFERTSGSFASVGGNLRLSDAWSLGGQAINVRDVQTIPGHTSAMGVVRYVLPQQAGRASLRALADDRGRFGIWSDADIIFGGMRNQFGVYRLDPGLLWADSQIANDQQGLYWRINRTELRQSWSGGVSYDDNNIRRSVAHGGQESMSGYAGTTLRLDRRLSVGGNLAIQSTRSRVIDTPLRRTLSGNLFTSISHPLGVSRIDVARYLLRPQSSPQDIVDTLSISHDWPPIRDFSISSALTGSRETSSGVETRRDSANLSIRSPSEYNLHWDLAVALAKVANNRGVEKNFNASVGGYWRINADLTASAQLIWSTIDPAPPLPGVTINPFRREKRVAFTLRYERASGTAFATTGFTQDRQFGTGRITGVVFFDENGDGIRQANERGAANQTIFLDGRLPITTDSNGRFVFSSVPTGLHTLTISTDSLPLPWTVDADSGFKITVPLRGEAVHDIALVRLTR